MTQQKDTEKISYFVTAMIHQVKIKKNVTFQSKVMWKRRQIKSETKTKHNEGAFSVFDESIVLPFTFIKNIQQNKFETKNTEFYSIVVSDKGLRAGGSAKYDISQILNEKLQNKNIKIPLEKSPDPQAYIQVSFSFQKQSQIFDNKSSCSQTSTSNSNSITFLNENSISQQSKSGNSNISKQNSKIDDKSFLKSKNRSPLQTIQNQFDLSQKIKDLQQSIKQASSTIKDRDYEILQLKSTVISNIQQQLMQQRQKNSILQQKLNQSKSLQLTVEELKNQLTEAKLNIGKIFNLAEIIGGSNFLNQISTQIGIVQKLDIQT